MDCVIQYWTNVCLLFGLDTIHNTLQYVEGQYRSITDHKQDIQSTPIISTSLISNNRLSWSENLVPILTWKSNNRQQNIVQKRRNFAPNSPLFHNIFNKSLTSGIKLHINLWNVVVWFIFSLILQIWYVKVRISRRISESPFGLRVDCTCIYIYICMMDAKKQKGT